MAVSQRVKDEITDLAIDAVRLTEAFNRVYDGKYMDIFNTEIIPEDRVKNTEDLQNYYHDTIEKFFIKEGAYPMLPDITTLTKNMIQHIYNYTTTQLKIDSRRYRNPFNKDEEIENVRSKHNVKQFITKFIEGIAREKFPESFSKEIPPNYTLQTPIAPNLQSTATKSVTSTTEKDTTNKRRYSEESDKALDSDKEKPLTQWQKAGDVTNPNTMLAYYYLKMRDYVRVLRRAMSFVRFSQGNEKEHTFIKVEKNGIVSVNHLFSQKKDQQRIKKLMRTSQIISYKIKNQINTGNVNDKVSPPKRQKTNY